MQTINDFLIPWAISNVVVIVILIAAIKRPKLARLLFVILFGWASWVNYTMAHENPLGYLDYAAITPFSIYRDFINGWFTEHVATMVTLISIGQGGMALGFLLKGTWVKIACFGAIVFFLAITPLGIGSGFPFPLIAIVAVYFILKKDDLNYLWKWQKKIHRI